MPSSGILRRVALARTDVSEKHARTTQLHNPEYALFKVTAVKTSNFATYFLFFLVVFPTNIRPFLFYQFLLHVLSISFSLI
jgi:hypothetical protein